MAAVRALARCRARAEAAGAGVFVGGGSAGAGAGAGPGEWAGAAAAAAASDARRATGGGGLRSALDGVPVAVKENFLWKGRPCTAASGVLRGFTAPVSATVVRRLEALGGVLVGQTNMDELGMGSFGLNSAHRPTPGPRGRVAGGSSSGSAAAVAAGAALLGVGSDTGGSVRLPAAYCGLAGLKPSYGRLSRSGLIAYASSLDCPGIIAREVVTAVAAVAALQGPDGEDMACLDADPELAQRHEFRDLLEGARAEGLAQTAPALLEGLRVGIPQEYHVEEMHPEVLEAWAQAAEALAGHGAEVVPVSMPHTELALPAYYLIATAEAASNFARYDSLRYGFSESSAGDPRGDDHTADDLHAALVATRTSAFGEEVRGRLMLGTFAVSAENAAEYHTKAQQIRTLVLRDFREAFRSVDVLLAPTAVSAAPTAAEAAEMGVVQGYATDAMTVPASLAGLPAMSVPVAQSRASGLPIGLQLVGRYAAELSLLAPGRALEVLRGEMRGELVAPFEGWEGGGDGGGAGGHGSD